VDEEDYTEAIEANGELAERVRHGDIDALPELIEAVTGVKVDTFPSRGDADKR